jgi:hypothetical protein
MDKLWIFIFWIQGYRSRPLKYRKLPHFQTTSWSCRTRNKPNIAKYSTNYLSLWLLHVFLLVCMICTLCISNVINDVLCVCNTLVAPSHDPPTVCVAKHQANAAQHPGVKNVTRSRMLLKSHKPVDPNSHTEEIPAEAYLCKPQVHLYMMCLFPVLTPRYCELFQSHSYRFLLSAVFWLWLPLLPVDIWGIGYLDYICSSILSLCPYQYNVVFYIFCTLILFVTQLVLIISGYLGLKMPLKASLL